MANKSCQTRVGMCELRNNSWKTDWQSFLFMCCDKVQRSSLYTTAIVLTFSSGSEGATGVSGLSVSAAWPFFLSPFLSFPFPVPGSPDLGRRGTNGMLGRKKNHVSLLIACKRSGGLRCAQEPPCRKRC